MSNPVVGESRPNVWLSLLLWLLPHSSFKIWALRKIGNTIGENCNLQPNLVFGCGPFHIGDNSFIRIGNVFRHLSGIRMGADALILNFNYFTAAKAYQKFSPHVGKLIIGDMAGITNRHYLDCSGQIVLRRNSGIGGMRSIFQSHEIDLVNNQSTVGRIVLEENAMTATHCLVLKDAIVPEKCVLAAGSVLTKTREVGEPGGLYVGVPARRARELSGFTWWDRDTLVTPITDFDDEPFVADSLGLSPEQEITT